ncbi:MAG: 30S ribosomal protein S8 [Candidatus Amesbacteria bacterium GW2011_GWA2_42_12]|uniref:Small ribosomal subunit protein uS8 n=1 Tax=Candidatus Amesbacteria bacterium GW2011_GWA2_42_12 TaxID=1618356 RepID=A0A0G1B6Y7_9BACT|nr:MAG: 30S ribosomal protein S8 [Candidatus Amesbacteria bacterium GW2011_GWA2_42_12]
MVNDYLSDLVIRIKNAYLSHATELVMPWTRTGEAVCIVLVQSGYLTSAKKTEDGLVLVLKYNKKSPALTNIRRISKPGRRVYTGIKTLPRVLGGLGMSILSTPKGVMSEKEARKLKVGGEILAQVW